MAEKKKRTVEQAEVPMSSMIDVVFLLLIYFIVTQKDEVSEAHLAVNLPSPNVAQKQENPDRPIELTVLRGKIRWRGRAMTADQIRETLGPLVKDDPELTVMIKTSTKALNGELVAVLDLCRSMGLTHLNVATLDD